MENSASEIERPADDVYGWVDQGASVMLKAVTRAGDPVELTAEEARGGSGVGANGRTVGAA